MSGITLPPGFGASALRTLRKSQRARPLRRKLATGDPLQDLLNEATRLGYSGDFNDIEAMAEFVLEELPTDDIFELMEELRAAGLIT